MQNVSKVLIGAAVIAAHMLGIAALVRAVDGPLVAEGVVAEWTGADWQLPEVVVVAHAAKRGGFPR